MQIVVVSSPGQGRSPHWSQDLAGEFGRLAVARGASVRWLAAVHADEPVPAGGPGLEVSAHRDRRVWPLSKVESSQLDAPLELMLTEILRDEPSSVVVHFGLGAQGTPNVLWISDRLGSQTFACVRGPEIVCHRGDVIDRDSNPCTDWLDAERCRWCCSDSRDRQPRSDDLRNRVDLYIAGLLTCQSISVPSPEDVPFLSSLGISGKQITVGATAEDLIERVFLSAGEPSV